MSAPDLPVRASTIRLPERAPPGVRTIFEFFLRRFPAIPASTWRARFAAGKVWVAAGPVDLATPYDPLLEVFYRREVEREPPVREDYRVLWSDGQLMVVDKPPNLPVTPGGSWVRACLLHLLLVATGNPHIAPLHRLDRLSSGLLLFSLEPTSRSRWARLMRAPGAVVKIYTAVCERRRKPPATRFTLAHHIARSAHEPWRQELRPELAANSRAQVTVLADDGQLVLLRVRLYTGRTHQIRVQLAAAGLPILGDPLYGSQPPYRRYDLQQRVWLDAHQLVVAEPSRTAPAALLNAVWFSGRAPAGFLARARAWRERGQSP